MSTTNETGVKAYTITELARLYGISLKTMRTWLSPHQHHIGPRLGRYYTVLQVRRIFECLGQPDSVAGA